MCPATYHYGFIVTPEIERRMKKTKTKRNKINLVIDELAFFTARKLQVSRSKILLNINPLKWPRWRKMVKKRGWSNPSIFSLCVQRFNKLFFWKNKLKKCIINAFTIILQNFKIFRPFIPFLSLRYVCPSNLKEEADGLL